MIVYKQETEAGVLQSITFRSEADEDVATFHAAVKTWIGTNYPAATWEDMWDKLTAYEADRITVDMT